MAQLSSAWPLATGWADVVLLASSNDSVSFAFPDTSDRMAMQGELTRFAGPRDTVIRSAGAEATGSDIGKETCRATVLWDSLRIGRGFSGGATRVVADASGG